MQVCVPSSLRFTLCPAHAPLYSLLLHQLPLPPPLLLLPPCCSRRRCCPPAAGARLLPLLLCRCFASLPAHTMAVLRPPLPVLCIVPVLPASSLY